MAKGELVSAAAPQERQQRQDRGIGWSVEGHGVLGGRSYRSYRRGGRG